MELTLTEVTSREKIVFNGELYYSFGKNGLGISNELIRIGEILLVLSKDNHITMSDACIDECDDVYDLKFTIKPKTANKWYTENKDNTIWYSNLMDLAQKYIDEHNEGESEETDKVEEVNRDDEAIDDIILHSFNVNKPLYS